MRIAVRGWSRNMGTTVLVDHELADSRVSNNENCSTPYGQPPVIFNSFRSKLYLAWSQAFRLMGDYRMEIKFSKSDIFSLFRCMYGRELNADLVERYGFTISDDLKKAVLKTVKLTDLTVGELVAMTGTPAESKESTNSAHVIEARRLRRI